MKLFGTDGIRGKAGEYPITADVALELGKAFVTLSSQPNPVIIVGRDTRESGSMLEEAVIAGITSAGGDAYPIGVIPSNAVSQFIQVNSAYGGVMISASHNPAEENGLKFFSSKGFKLSVDEEEALERIFFDKSFASAEKPGEVYNVSGVKQDYNLMVTGSLQGRDLAGLKVGVDTGNGAASHLAKDLFYDLKADASIINNDGDGSRINYGGAINPNQLQELVKANRLDAGIAFDGDADRLVVVDELGGVMDGDILLAIAAIHLNNNGRLKHNAIVVTEYSNTGLDASLKKRGISVVRVANGDKYVSDMLFKEGYSLGGERTGHIIFSDYAKTGDGVLAGIQALSIVRESGKALSELAEGISLFPQTLVNVEVREKRPIEDMPAVASAIRHVEESLSANGRVFIRYSGTESKMRILVEGESEKQIKEYANSIAGAVRAEIGA